MPSLCLDHFLTFTDAVTLEDHLAGYRAAGFNVLEHTVRHNPGLRTGFVGFGLEYIEFCWVEDEDLFAAGSTGEHVWRQAVRPHGIGIVTENVQELYKEWNERGYTLPAVWSAAPRDAPPDTPPRWSFQQIPADLLPGAECFALTYHHRSRLTLDEVCPAPNAIYAITGVTFVSPEPEARAQQWRALLAPAAHMRHAAEAYHVPIGPHVATWITPATYQQLYHRSWPPSPHPQGELAVLHLAATDLGQASTLLQAAGRSITRLPPNHSSGTMLLLSPDEHDGFLFTIEERSLELWRSERAALTGKSAMSAAQEQCD